MKKILLFAVTALLLTGCKDDVFDKVTDIYEDAADKVLAAGSRDELRQVERELNAEYSKLKVEHSAEFVELELNAKNGDKKAVKRLDKLNGAKRLYRDAKQAKRKELKNSK